MSLDLSYKSTPDLPDTEGIALLENLEELHATTHWSASNKKVRRGSNEERCAITALRKALLDAADRFSSHEKFTTWLNENMRYHIDAYDPLKVPSEWVHTVRDLKWEVDVLKERTDGLNSRADALTKALLELIVQQPRKKADAA
jgi:hypothetical protein